MNNYAKRKFKKQR